MFSVIIPLYNKEATIRTTLCSVFSQTFKDFEVIVVNDGSTDNSLQIAHSFADDRLRIYSKTNEGVSETRNFAVAKAQYDYLAFLDADDTWEPSYLEEIAELIKKYPESVLYSCAYAVIQKNKVSWKCYDLPEGILDDFFERRLHNCPVIRTSAAILKKTVFLQLGMFPKGMIAGEDDYLWTKVAIDHKIAFTPKILVSYNNITSTFNERKGKLDSCRESWLNLYERGQFYRNEFIAQKAITAGIRYAFGPSQTKSLEIERLTRYTVLFKKQWRYLYFLNRTPYSVTQLIRISLPVYKQVRYWLSKRALIKYIKKNTSGKRLIEHVPLRDMPPVTQKQSRKTWASENLFPNAFHE